MDQLIGKSVAEAETVQRQAEQKALRKRRRIQTIMVGAGVVGVLIGVRLTQPHKNAAVTHADEAAIEGDWELVSVNGLPVGPRAESVIISQKVHFHDGKLQGETHVVANSEAGTTAMPFPDESVAEVKAGLGNNEVVVLWSGSYFTLPNHIVEMHIGKATYRVTMQDDSSQNTLNMEQDAILTYRGPAAYRASTPLATQRTARLP